MMMGSRGIINNNGRLISDVVVGDNNASSSSVDDVAKECADIRNRLFNEFQAAANAVTKVTHYSFIVQFSLFN
jgi:hypothetical protein